MWRYLSSWIWTPVTEADVIQRESDTEPNPIPNTEPNTEPKHQPTAETKTIEPIELTESTTPLRSPLADIDNNLAIYRIKRREKKKQKNK